ncbi:MAG: hypothetical protein Q9165_008932, partial [Trypethelium subeluteriae]
QKQRQVPPRPQIEELNLITVYDEEEQKEENDSEEGGEDHTTKSAGCSAASAAPTPAASPTRFTADPRTVAAAIASEQVPNSIPGVIDDADEAA